MIEQVNKTSPFNMVVTVKSETSGKKYDVSVIWFINENRWDVISCGKNCKGFAQHMRCKHVREVEEYCKTLPKPVGPYPTLRFVGKWYECEICNGKTFFIRPPLNAKGANQCVCSECGKSYEMI